MAEQIRRHGRTHRPGGSDPIPGLQDGQWPTWHLMMPYTDTGVGDEFPSYTKTLDLAGTLGGGYIESTTDGAYAIWPVRLGPYGSVWEVFIVFHKGSDYGRIEYQFANADDDEYGAGRYTLNADATWVSVGSGLRDFYAASPATNQDAQEHAFRIKGADGATLTSISGTDPDVAAAYVFDGGSGLYLFRTHVSGKNASSSGYRTRIAQISIKRIPG